MTVRCICFFPPDVVLSAVTQLSSCLADVAAWLSASRLRLNPSKKVVIWLGSKYQVDRVGVHAVPVLTSTVPIVDSARAFGVVLDSRLTMAAHVGSVFVCIRRNICRTTVCQSLKLPVVSNCDLPLVISFY